MPKKKTLSYRTCRNKGIAHEYATAKVTNPQPTSIKRTHATSTSNTEEQPSTSAEQSTKEQLQEIQRDQPYTSGNHAKHAHTSQTTQSLPKNEIDTQQIATLCTGSSEVLHPTKKRRVQPQAGIRGSTRLRKCQETLQYTQTPTVVQPHNVPAQDDPVALAIIQRRTAETLPTTYCEARFDHNDISEGCDIGGTNFICHFCGAMLFQSEVSDNSSKICCHKGKISLQEIQVPPILKELIQNNNEDTHNYLQNIRQCNSDLAFASVNVN